MFSSLAAMLSSRAIRGPLSGQIVKSFLHRHGARPALLSFAQYRFYADKIVQVPQMAESISEGTLRQWTKQIGDHVAQDEEIATIETDKIDVAVNAPAAGIIREFLVNEEDTVTVGQDIVKLELSDEGSTTSTAEKDEVGPSKQEDDSREVREEAPEQEKEETKSAAPEPESKPEPPKQKPEKPMPSRKPDPPKQTPPPEPPKHSTAGERDERRVGHSQLTSSLWGSET